MQSPWFYDVTLENRPLPVTQCQNGIISLLLVAYETDRKKWLTVLHGNKSISKSNFRKVTAKGWAVPPCHVPWLLQKLHWVASSPNITVHRYRTQKDQHSVLMAGPLVTNDINWKAFESYHRNGLSLFEVHLPKHPQGKWNHAGV